HGRLRNMKKAGSVRSLRSSAGLVAGNALLRPLGECMKSSSRWLALVPFTFCLSLGCGGVTTQGSGPGGGGPGDGGTNGLLSLGIQNIDKVDLLLVIDNSASMGDKQEILSAAVPDLVRRLVTPNCVDASNRFIGISDAQGKCAEGKPEFPPVHDMHIGIVTS